MPYFQNVYNQDFFGVLVLADRQASISFKIGPNTNSSKLMAAFNPEPYDLSVLPDLTINYSVDAGRSYASFTVDVSTTAANTSAVRAYEVASALNADATFNALYEAITLPDGRGKDWLQIRAKKSIESWKTYIDNSSAESIIRFNKKAGVAELPTYFSRHTIGSLETFPDSLNSLIELSDPLAGVDIAIVEEAGFDSTVVREDWELLEGRSGLFTFQKITVDGSDRITQIIEYPAGAEVGDFSRQIDYVYSGANTHPSQITEIPHTLVSGDLVTP